MRIALIDVPLGRMAHPRWEDICFPGMHFPIHEFLSHTQNQLKVWDFKHAHSFDIQKFLSELQDFQPVIVGINDFGTTNGLIIQTLIKQSFPQVMIFYSPDSMSAEDLIEQANQAAFSLRHRTKPMAGRVRMRKNWKDDTLFSIFNSAEQIKKAQMIEEQFYQTYQLNQWKQYLPAEAYRRTLYTLEILEQFFEKSLACWKEKTLRILDIGAGDWSYAPAIYQFFKHKFTDEPRMVYMTGIEVDPYRVNQEGYSNVDYACSYIDPIASYCTYLTEDILHYEPEAHFNIALQFLPFVLRKAPLYWGLPLKYFQPEKQLSHTLNLLIENGYIFIANEIQEEFEDQQLIFSKLQIAPLKAEAVCSQIRSSSIGFGSLAQK